MSLEVQESVGRDNTSDSVEDPLTPRNLGLVLSMGLGKVRVS